MDYKEDLRKKLPELKQIEGFPKGEDDDIINLSTPPFYTACPNPYIKDFIENNGTVYDEENDNYHKEPFVGDVSEGKNEPIYKSHTYVTKVPYKAIQPFIKNFTSEGDVVYDGFGGSGMTGVAALSLNRKVIIGDLSPIATFITKSFLTKTNSNVFIEKLVSILDSAEEKYSWMYETKHKQEKGKITYVVWSDILECPYCKSEVDFWNQGIDHNKYEFKELISCTGCGSQLKKSECNKKYVERKSLGEVYKVVKQVPVLIKYKYGKESFEKSPDDFDFEVLRKIEEINIPYWVPTYQLNEGHNLNQPIRSHGFTSSELFFTKRSLLLLGYIKEMSDDETLVLLTSMLNRASKTVKTLLSNYFAAKKGKTIGGWAGTPLTGTLYIPSISTEVSILEAIKNRSKSLLKLQVEKESILKSQDFAVSTNSSTKSLIPDNSIDYIFTDPPFGENIMYSELNFISECWLKVFTNNNKEAIINKFQNKGASEYKQLIIETFKDYYRVLKPKRWITVEFNNSKSSIWNLIQESIGKAGFIIAQVSILDKKQGSFKQVNSPNSVKSDLIISAFKPDTKIENKIKNNLGKESELDFLNEFLTNLPVRPLIERTSKMLYSKMVSYYLNKNYEINYNSSDFYNLIKQNFIEQDGFWFTANQINSYSEYLKKIKLEGIEEVQSGAMMLFVSDEKSAILWIYNFLTTPKTFSDIHLEFTQVVNIQGDQVPELSQLLEDNFVKENNVYRRPTSEEEHNSLNTKREKVLMREFESLLLRAKSERKKIKEVRKEALVYGFEQCYKDKRFKDILTLEERLDKKIIENSSELNDFVEAAKIMVEGIN